MKKPNQISGTILFLYFFGCIVNGYAQEKDSTNYAAYFSLDIEDLMNLDVSTASKNTEKLSLAPATLYVITEEDIINYGYQDLQEALKSVPSVYLSNPHSWVWGGQRGFLSNFSQTLLMINSREVNNLIAFEGFISHQFSTHNIKQIEILASPGSALYGANALAGIINIITKDQNNTEDYINVSMDGGSFNTKTFNLSLNKTLKKDFRVSFDGSFYSSDEEDFGEWTSNTKDFVPNWNDRTLVNNYENHGQYRNRSLSIPFNFQINYKGLYAGANYYYNKQSHGQEKPNWDFTDSEDLRNFSLWFTGYKGDITDKLSFSVDYSKVFSKFWGRYYSDLWPTARLQNPGFAKYFSFDQWSPNTGIRQGHQFQMLSYNSSQALIYDQTYNDSLILQDYYSSFASYLIDQNLIDPENITKDDVHKYFMHIYTNKDSEGSQRDKFELQLLYDLADRHHITTGFVYDNIYYVGLVVTDAGTGIAATYDIPVDLSKRNPVYTSIKKGAFVQYQGELWTNKLWLTLGARIDHQNHYGTSFNPRCGIIFQARKKDAFKILYGEAFREGNVFELSGKSDLEPAKLRALEISYSYTFNNNLKNDIVYYHNQVNNFLGSVGSIIGSNVSSVEKQQVSGIEDIFNFKLGKFSGFISGAYIFNAKQYATNIESGELDWFDVLSLPPSRISVGTSYLIQKHISLSLLNHYVSSYDALGGSSRNVIEIENYNDLSVTLNMINIKLNSVGQLHLMFTIKNLLNQEYYHPNIRLSGTEKFLQNSRYAYARLKISL
ncbi:MAG: TonB-dependent receptor [Bacteroidales bacterium]|nr:TonB-dependent receptor [Bacteroidales bacterium]